MPEEYPYIVVEDLEGGKFSIYDNYTLEVALLDGEAQEGLDEEDAGLALDRLERLNRLSAITED